MLPTTERNEEVLSVDVGERDFLYRIRRYSRFVYVNVLHEDLIPEEDRTWSPVILSHLRKLPKWDENWKTLTVRKSPDGVIESTMDEFQPHTLDLETLGIRDPTYFDVMDIKVVLAHINHHVDQVSVENSDITGILKIAPFEFMVSAMRREVYAYSALALRGYELAPKVLGYVYEESKARVIGFLIETIMGKTPTPEDFKDCEKALRMLHKCDILHGDVNKYNFLVTDHRAIVIDFEVATVKRVGEVEGSEEAENEIKMLEEQLKNDDTAGRPFLWPVNLVSLEE